MKIKRILNPVAQENTYILENESASLVIDPGSNTSSILAKLEAIAKPVAAILLTHTHYDHIMSVEAVRKLPDIHFQAPSLLSYPFVYPVLQNKLCH